MDIPFVEPSQPRLWPEMGWKEGGIVMFPPPLGTEPNMVRYVTDWQDI